MIGGRALIDRVLGAGADAIISQAPLMMVHVAMAAVAQTVPGVEMLLTVKDELALLAFAGVFGSFAKAVMFPERGWRRRTAYGISSAVSAVFLGGTLAVLAVKLGMPDVFAFLASGFIMGFAGEKGISAVQSKVMGRGQ